MTSWSMGDRECRHGGGWTSALIGGAMLAGMVSTLAAATPAGRGTGNWRAAATAAYVAAKGGVSAASAHVNLNSGAATAIPAFARKYNLACSACHTAWPELNAFGQTFKDNGYQLGNDRDSPIWLNPSYWPIAIRTTPQWRMERTTHQPVDDGAGGTTEKTITQSGFDISGADILMLGTLYRNITFGFVPTIADGEGVGIETAYVRFDNLFQSRWANLKIGKFELDNMLSEKRGMMLSTNGTFYQGYHFLPPGNQFNDFGLGDNQIGMEWLGHSVNSYTRFSVAVLGSVSGTPGLPSGKSYDGFFSLNQAFEAGTLGLQRVGIFGYVGQRPTTYETSGGEPVPGTGSDNKPFYRFGAVGDFFLGKFEAIPFVMHAEDDKGLNAGIQHASWNDALIEFHYYVNPQLVFTQRDEIVRMSQQADPANAKNYGDIDAYTFGYRWYPIMFSRAGLAFIGELTFTKTIGTMPLSGAGVGLDPLSPSTAVESTSLLFALDFDF